MKLQGHPGGAETAEEGARTESAPQCIRVHTHVVSGMEPDGMFKSASGPKGAAAFLHRKHTYMEVLMERSACSAASGAQARPHCFCRPGNAAGETTACVSDTMADMNQDLKQLDRCTIRAFSPSGSSQKDGRPQTLGAA